MPTHTPAPPESSSPPDGEAGGMTTLAVVIPDDVLFVDGAVKRWSRAMPVWMWWNVRHRTVATGLLTGALAFVLTGAGYIIEDVLPRWGINVTDQPYFTQGQGQGLSTKVDVLGQEMCNLIEAAGQDRPDGCDVFQPPPE